MYTEFLETCTEQQLFVFIEMTMVAVYMESDRAGPEWTEQQRQDVISAIRQLTRFGVETPIVGTKATENFWTWYHKWLHGWWVNLTDKQVIEQMKGIPWNVS